MSASPRASAMIRGRRSRAHRAAYPRVTGKVALAARGSPYPREWLTCRIWNTSSQNRIEPLSAAGTASRAAASTSTSSVSRSVDRLSASAARPSARNLRSGSVLSIGALMVTGRLHAVHSGRRRGASRQLPQHEAFEVVRLRDAEDDGVVAGLPALLDDGHRRGRVGGRRGQDLLEVGLVDMIGARAGDQAAARLEQLEGAEVDLLVPAHGLLDRVLALGEGGRVEDHGVEALAAVVQIPQEVEDVGLASGDVREPVALRIPDDLRHGL